MRVKDCGADVGSFVVELRTDQGVDFYLIKF
jgi:hypothetical protein